MTKKRKKTCTANVHDGAIDEARLRVELEPPEKIFFHALLIVEVTEDLLPAATLLARVS